MAIFWIKVGQLVILCISMFLDSPELSMLSKQARNIFETI